VTTKTYFLEDNNVFKGILVNSIIGNKNNSNIYVDINAHYPLRDNYYRVESKSKDFHSSIFLDDINIDERRFK